jgi:hypothetical protein
MPSFVEGLQVQTRESTITTTKSNANASKAGGVKPKGLKDVTNKLVAVTKPAATKTKQQQQLKPSTTTSTTKPPASFFSLDLDLDTYMEYCPPSLPGKDTLSPVCVCVWWLIALFFFFLNRQPPVP